MLLNLIIALGSIIFMIYAVYYGLLWSLAKGRNREAHEANELPRITVIIPCYNDSPKLEMKLVQTAAQYPADRIQIIVVWSQPPGQSSEIIQRFQSTSVEFITEATRTGKAGAIDLALSRAREEIIVITDVDATLVEGSLRRLVRDFVMPDVGAVSGRLVYSLEGGKDSILDMAFNRYQNNLREYESLLDSSSYAYGELLAFRRSIIPQIPKDAIVDDLYVCWKVRSTGSRCVASSESIAKEGFPNSLRGAIVKAGRIVTGNLVEFNRFRFLLFRRRYGFFGSLILPFYLLRVILSPLLFLLLLLSLAWYVTVALLVPFPQILLLVVVILGVIVVVPQSRWRLKSAFYWAAGGICGTILGLTNYAIARRSPVWKSVEKSTA